MDDFTLTDGTGVAFRHIRPDDKEPALRGRARPAVARVRAHKRFLSPKPRLSASRAALPDRDRRVRPRRRVGGARRRPGRASSASRGSCACATSRHGGGGDRRRRPVPGPGPRPRARPAAGRRGARARRHALHRDAARRQRRRPPAVPRHLRPARGPDRGRHAGPDGAHRSPPRIRRALPRRRLHARPAPGSARGEGALRLARRRAGRDGVAGSRPSPAGPGPRVRRATTSPCARWPGAWSCAARGVRGGIDVRGDGSAEAYTGWIRKQLVESEGDESPVESLRRALLSTGRGG